MPLHDDNIMIPKLLCKALATNLPIAIATIYSVLKKFGENVIFFNSLMSNFEYL